MPTLEDITNMLKGVMGRPPSYSTPTSNYIPSGDNPPYPTPDDAAFARKYDYSYASPYANEFEGKNFKLLNEVPSNYQDTPFKAKFLENNDPRTGAGSSGDVYAKAQLAAERSALAKLGYNPSETALDFSRNANKINLAGLTLDPNAEYPKGQPISKKTNDLFPNYMYANANRNDPTQSSIIHESIHRGIDKLRASPFWNPKFDYYAEPDMNESVVRYLMDTKMGSPEGNMGPEEMRMIKDSRDVFSPDTIFGEKRRKGVEEMENAAAQYLAAKRPGGPR